MQTLTSEIGDSIPGERPRRGMRGAKPGPIVCSRMEKMFFDNIFSKVVIFTKDAECAETNEKLI